MAAGHALWTLLSSYRHARMTREKLSAYRDHSLRRIVRHAYENVQEREGLVVLRAVPAVPPRREELGTLKELSLDRLGAGVEFRIELVRDIQRVREGSSGSSGQDSDRPTTRVLVKRRNCPRA